MNRPSFLHSAVVGELVPWRVAVMVWVPLMGRVIFGFDGLLVICGTAERGEKFGCVTTSVQ